MLEKITRLICRFRYPVSLPEDVARDLGMYLPNTLRFQSFLKSLSIPRYRPTNVRKFMFREAAEAAFGSALKKESFKSCSLFSYYFNKGWLVFALYFDDAGRLRRLYLQCPTCVESEGFDIPLEEDIFVRASSH